LRYLAILLIPFFTYSFAAYAEGCKWEAVNIEISPKEAASVEPWRYKGKINYTGKIGNYSVKWVVHNDPGFQLIFSNNTTNSQCKVNTKGNITLKYTYYSPSSNVFAITTHGGSSENIEFYEVESCKLLARADISTYELVSSKSIIDQGYCKCREKCEGVTAICYPATVYTLNNKCLPTKDEKLSAKFTKEKYGISFNKPSLIHSPMTDKAKIVIKK